MPVKGGEYEVQGLAAPECFEVLHALFEQVQDEHPDLASLDLSMLETAIIEIVGNVVEHGRPPGEVVYNLSLEVTDSALRAGLTDTGDDFGHGPEAERLVPDEMAEAGRGLILAEAVLDELLYQRTEHGNHWTMVRGRQPAG